MSRRCEAERRRLDFVLVQLRNVRYQVLEEAQRIDGAVIQMRDVLQYVLKRGWERVHSVKHELIGRSPESRVSQGLAHVPQLRSRLDRAMRYALNRQKQEAQSYLTSLNALSPLGILARGYSIMETLSGHQVIRDARQVAVGEAVLARLNRGQLRCLVDDVIPDPSV
jgi:exodeoxyribonuclease VII large subunit